ncbi:MAG: hypothetical protein IJW40_05220 [Clostridia bacterium]|nr:hypothetical protein [Clostridia bacterium]
MNKLTIVINGKGGVGKDTLCLSLTDRRVRNVSSITPIKEIASQHGWNGEKDLKSRRFLAELKRVFTEYNDLPNRYLVEQYREFLEGDEDILFVHIREADQIKAFVQGVHGDCITLLVRRDLPETAQGYGNRADDDVENYPYDVIFDNNHPLEQSTVAFSKLIDELLHTKLSQ